MDETVWKLQREANKMHHTLIAICKIASELHTLEVANRGDEVQALLDLMDWIADSAHILCSLLPALLLIYTTNAAVVLAPQQLHALDFPKLDTTLLQDVDVAVLVGSRPAGKHKRQSTSSGAPSDDIPTHAASVQQWATTVSAISGAAVDLRHDDAGGQVSHVDTSLSEMDGGHGRIAVSTSGTVSVTGILGTIFVSSASDGRLIISSLAHEVSQGNGSS